MPRARCFLLGLAGLLVAGVAVPAPAAHAQSAVHSYRSTLLGANEVPPTGTAAATTVVVTVDEATTTVCAYLDLQGMPVSDIAAMHIHTAPAGVNGPVVVPFTVGTTACTTADASLLTALVAAPDQFYFNVHTAAYPNGAARGQLVPVTETRPPVALTGTLSSGAEVPPNATPTTGVVGVVVDTNTLLVCVSFALVNRDISEITAMHIHQAVAGANGPVVIPFTVGTSECAVANATTVASLIANPAAFYFNIHTGAYPAGEARAQLTAVSVTPAAGTDDVPAATPTDAVATPTDAETPAAPETTEAVRAEAVEATPAFTG
jgi:hypothetical protein